MSSLKMTRGLLACALSAAWWLGGCTTIPTRDAGPEASTERDGSEVDADAQGSLDAAMDALVETDAGSARSDGAADSGEAGPTDAGSTSDARDGTSGGGGGEGGLACAPPTTACDGECVDLRTSGENCGACGNACGSRANATVSCAMGACAIACNPGFADCDRNAANGCEATLDTVMNCGACGTACSGATPVCDALMRRCVSGCSAPAQRCSGTCVDVTSSVTNCGACGTVCSLANATAACTAGTCRIMTCNAGYADCDTNPANGCEVNVGTDSRNCGRCGGLCLFAPTNATPVCSGGMCGFSCQRGFSNCDGNSGNGCETAINTTSNCNRCGITCASGPNSTPVCSILGCGLSCATGFGNCDSSTLNGCETNTNTSVTNCGGCGYTCPTPPVGFTATCVAGRCQYGAACDPRMGDCDRNAMTGTNGYETNLDNNSMNCGGCGVVCAAGLRCCNGRCTTSICPPCV